MARRTSLSVLVGCLLLVGAGFTTPSALAQSVGDTTAYVVNHLSDTVSVVDTSTSTVTWTIPVGSHPQRVVFTPDGAKAYVTNSLSGTVSVIDTSSHTVTTTISVGPTPTGIDVSPDGAKAYVATNGAVWIIDTATDTVSGSFAVTGGNPSSPVNLAFTPDGSAVWVNGGCGNCVKIFSYPGNTEIGTVGGVVGNAERLDFLPDGSFAFANNTCGGCGNLQKISTASNSVVASHSYGGAGNGLVVAPDAANLYAGTQGGGNQVKRFNPASLSVTGSVPVAGPPEGFAITPDGQTLYTALVVTPGQVAVIDTSTLTVTATIPVGNHPIDVALKPAAPARQLTELSPAKVWVGLKNSDDVGVKFDLRTEAYKNGVLVSSGQLNSVAAGSSGFNNARLNTIPFDSFAAVDFPPGSVLGFKLYVRNACTGSGHNSGTARLWFNDGAANSRFDATIGGSTSDYYLRDGFLLATTPGPGPKKTIDVAAGAKCSPFKPFGTWTAIP
jgi:YVTN family beta-propeller protein